MRIAAYGQADLGGYSGGMTSGIAVWLGAVTMPYRWLPRIWP